MRIAIIGGTGNEGAGMAKRWARAGHRVVIGSRDAARANARAHALTAEVGVTIEGVENAAAATGADLVVLAVPYAAHAATLDALADAVAGRIVVDITVPLRPPGIRRVWLPPGRAAALEAQTRLGATAKIVAALHHVSASHLADADHAVECDVLVCSDHADALATVLGLVSDLGLRALDAGPLDNAVALEALTPVLLHLNRRYGGSGAGVRFTGV